MNSDRQFWKLSRIATMPRRRRRAGVRSQRNWTTWARRFRARFVAAHRQFVRQLLRFRRPAHAKPSMPTRASHATRETGGGNRSAAPHHFTFHSIIRIDCRAVHAARVTSTQNIGPSGSIRLHRGPSPAERVMGSQSITRPNIGWFNRPNGLIHRPRTATANLAATAESRVIKPRLLLRNVSDGDTVVTWHDTGNILVRRFRRREQRQRERLSHQSSAPPAMPPRSRRVIEPAAPPEASARPAPQAFASQPQTPLNVDALADRVMDKINHRMTAWRERTGRA